MRIAKYLIAIIILFIPVNAFSWLTDITAVNGNDITVTDAGFFYDGWGIPGEVGDTIYDDDTPHSSAVIQSINYTTNVLTVDDSTGFTVGEKITIVNWVGSAPDVGAYEYGGPIQNHCPVCVIDTPTGDDVIADGTDVDFQATCIDADSDTMTYTWYDNGVSCGTSEDLGPYGDTEWDNNSTHVMTLIANDGQCDSTVDANNTRTIEVGSPTSTTITFGDNSTNTYQSGHIDNSIWEGGPTNNNGTRTYMYIGPSASADADEALLAFDLTNASGLTATDCKVCATIYDPPTSAHTLTLYANQDAFTETGSNWNTYDGTNAWTGTRGQNGSKATVSSGTTDEAEVCFQDADLLTYVNSAVGGMCRFSITGSVNDDKVQLHTRESTDTKRPYLSFTYTEPSGVDLAECWFESNGPFKQGDTVNAWVKYPVGSEISFTTDGDGTPQIEFETGASDIVLTLQTPSETPQNAHLFSGTVGAGENSSDLTPTGAGIDLQGWTASNSATVTWPASPYRFQDQNDCVIDTTAIDFSAGTFYHCDADMAQIDAETTYTTGDTCYLCLQSNASQDIYYKDGPLGNLKIDTNLDYPSANSEWEFYALQDDIIQFSRTIAVGDRSVDLQAAGTAEGTGFIHGATTISDYVENTTVYTLPQADPDGGNIIIAGPTTFYIAASGADATTYTNLITAIDHNVPGDTISFNRGETFTETINLTDSGTSGNLITFNSYGSGADPIIQTPETDLDNSWTQVGATAVYYRVISDPDWVGQVCENDTPMTFARNTVKISSTTLNGDFYNVTTENAPGTTDDFNNWIETADASVQVEHDTTQYLSEMRGGDACKLTQDADGDTEDCYIYTTVTLASSTTYYLTYGTRSDGTATGGIKIYKGASYLQDNGTWGGDNLLTAADWVAQTTDTAWARKSVSFTTAADSAGSYNIVFANVVDSANIIWIDNVYLYAQNLTSGTYTLILEQAGDSGSRTYDVRVYVNLSDDSAPTNNEISYYNDREAIDLTDESYVTIDGLEVHGAISANSTDNEGYITIQNCTIKYAGSGVQTHNKACGAKSSQFTGAISMYECTGSNGYGNIDINNCTISDCLGQGIWTQNSGTSFLIHDNTIQNFAYGEGLYIAAMYLVSFNDGNIYLNTVQTAGDDGSSQIGRNVNGIWVDVGSDDNNIYRNWVEGVNNRGIFTENGSDRNVISYNVVKDCQDGIRNGSVDTGGDDIDIYNNVILETTQAGIYLYDDNTGSGTIEIKNNIINPTSGYFIGKINLIGNTLDIDNNCYDTTFGAATEDLWYFESSADNFTEWKAETGIDDANSLSDDPLFRDSVNDDYHLTGGSPCVDAGTDVSLTSDYAGRYVPRGGAPDIGAYEFSRYNGHLHLGLGLN